VTKPSEALDALERAVKAGFGPRGVVESDEDLASLRAEARFKAILTGMDAPPKS
jgi:hypothetical protein